MKLFNSVRRLQRRSNGGNDEQVSFVKHYPRTRNGASDLLSSNNNNNGTANNIYSIGDPPTDDDPSYAPVNLYLHDDVYDLTTPMYIEEIEDDLPPRRGSESSDDDIYKRLDSFEEKLESELQELEALGVDVGASPERKKKQDPDGKGQRSPSTVSTSSASTASSSASSPEPNRINTNIVTIGNGNNYATIDGSSLERGQGKSGKKLVKLSHKTNKIMSDYQAYLAEIQTGFPVDLDVIMSEHGDEENGGTVAILEENEDPAFIHQVRENVRYSYLEDQAMSLEAEDRNGGGSDNSSTSTPPREDNYATGGGEPLQRAWNYESHNSFNNNHLLPNEMSRALMEANSDCGECCGYGNRPRRRRYGASHYQRYQPAWLRGNRRVQRGLCMVVLVAVVIGISVGVANVKKGENLPDWEGEYEAELELEEAAAQSREQPVVASSVPGGEDNALPGDWYAVMEKEKEKGEEEMKENHSAQEVNEDIKHKVAANAMVIGLPKDEPKPEPNEATEAAEAIVAEVAAESSLTPAAEAILSEVAAESSSSIEYPSNAKSNSILEEEKNDENVSPATKHLTLEGANTNAYGAAAGSDAATKEAEDELAMDVYYNAVMRYRPTMYNRSKGWTGTTYVEALVFCEKQGGLAVCPYDAICPHGSSGEPLGGYRESGHGDWSWMPIVDDYNEWVQGGAREKCVKYSHRYGGEKPEWGDVQAEQGEREGVVVVDEEGSSSKDLTQNLMCCLNVM